jgi:phosphohistidine phosphatase
VTRLAVYLVRHEAAESYADGGDAYRALTGDGRRRMRRTARFLATQEGRVDHVLTSPLVRAVQTAEILAGELGLDEPLEVRPVIATPPRLTSIAELATSLPATTRGVAVVGHEPTLSLLTAHLLGEQGQRWTGFSTGTVLRLDHDPSTGRWHFAWWIDPGGPSRHDTLGG